MVDPVRTLRSEQRVVWWDGSVGKQRCIQKESSRKSRIESTRNGRDKSEVVN
jgi:hypothetical protein